MLTLFRRTRDKEVREGEDNLNKLTVSNRINRLEFKVTVAMQRDALLEFPVKIWDTCPYKVRG